MTAPAVGPHPGRADDGELTGTEEHRRETVELAGAAIEVLGEGLMVLENLEAATTALRPNVLHEKKRYQPGKPGSSDRPAEVWYTMVRFLVARHTRGRWSIR